MNSLLHQGRLEAVNVQPATRSLKQVIVDSAAEADHLFSMLMDGELTTRRDFIEQNAKCAKLNRKLIH